MSTKIEINLVAAAMKKHAVDAATMRAIIEDLNLEAQPEGGEEKEPAVKKQFVVLLSDPTGRLSSEFYAAAGFSDFAAWVLQIPESEAPATATDRIKRAAYDFNATKKGRLLPVASIGEAIENVPARFMKEHDVWAKTKTPVLVVRTDNVLPKS